MHPGDTILDAGLRAGLDLPYSCRVGVCGTCAVLADPGEVDPGPDVPRGRQEVLACQSRPLSECIVVNFDAPAIPLK